MVLGPAYDLMLLLSLRPHAWFQNLRMRGLFDDFGMPQLCPQHPS